jgi:hypothetical protein
MPLVFFAPKQLVFTGPYVSLMDSVLHLHENMNTVAIAAALKLSHINKKGGAGFLAGTVVTVGFS